MDDAVKNWYVKSMAVLFLFTFTHTIVRLDNFVLPVTLSSLSYSPVVYMKKIRIMKMGVCALCHLQRQKLTIPFSDSKLYMLLKLSDIHK